MYKLTPQLRVKPFLLEGQQECGRYPIPCLQCWCHALDSLTSWDIPLWAWSCSEGLWLCRSDAAKGWVVPWPCSWGSYGWMRREGECSPCSSSWGRGGEMWVYERSQLTRVHLGEPCVAFWVCPSVCSAMSWVWVLASWAVVFKIPWQVSIQWLYLSIFISFPLNQIWR